MTDSELNDLLATKVMGWRKHEQGNVWETDIAFVASVSIWNPCTDYNHLRQVEEALSEEQRYLYAKYLWGDSEDDESLSVVPVVVDVIYSPARQRCDAIARVVGDV